MLDSLVRSAVGNFENVKIISLSSFFFDGGASLLYYACTSTSTVLNIIIIINTYEYDVNNSYYTLLITEFVLETHLKYLLE